MKLHFLAAFLLSTLFINGGFASNQDHMVNNADHKMSKIETLINDWNEQLTEDQKKEIEKNIETLKKNIKEKIKEALVEFEKNIPSEMKKKLKEFIKKKMEENKDTKDESVEVLDEAIKEGE